MGEANMKNWKSLGQTRQSIIIFSSTALVLAAYEFLKELLFKDSLTPWESNSITIFVISIFATTVSLIMRKWVVSPEDELRIAAVALDAQEGMVATDAHSVAVQDNHAFTEIAGYTAEEAVGQTPRLLNSGRHDETSANAGESLQHAGVWRDEILNLRKSGGAYMDYLHHRSEGK